MPPPAEQLPATDTPSVVPKKKVALAMVDCVVTVGIVIKNVDVPVVKGLCGLLPAIDAFAD